ncbi:MAG: Na(+)/H(+) antiporter subunit B [Streptosporangiaceae bacterium]
MTILIAVALTLVALAGTAVVATNMPERQAVTLSFFGLTLTVLFLALQAPDVALSEIGVGAAIVPLMVMLAIRTMSGRHAKERAASRGSEDNRAAGGVLPERGTKT